MITLAITNYNRYELLRESYSALITDSRVDEIIILDDASDLPTWELVSQLNGGKVKVMRQAQNRGMSVNKKDAIAYSKNEWVLIGDSDNVFKPDYIDALPIGMDKQTIYMPSFAWPQFNFKKFEGQTFDRKNIANLVLDQMGNVSMNCCNYVVHRDSYLSVFKENPEMRGTDTLWFNYLWLAAGNKFHVVKDCHYYHRVHNGSGFMEDVNYNMSKADELRKMILAL